MLRSSMYNTKPRMSNFSDDKFWRNSPVNRKKTMDDVLGIFKDAHLRESEEEAKRRPPGLSKFSGEKQEQNHTISSSDNSPPNSPQRNVPTLSQKESYINRQGLHIRDRGDGYSPHAKGKKRNSGPDFEAMGQALADDESCKKKKGGFQSKIKSGFSSFGRIFNHHSKSDTPQGEKRKSGSEKTDLENKS